LVVDWSPDLFIYRAGAGLGLRGVSPYDSARIAALVAEKYPDVDRDKPDDEKLVNNCGFFVPPLAVFVFAPFAALPWRAAKLLWALVNALAAAAICLAPRLFRRPGDPPPGPPLVWHIVPVILLRSEEHTSELQSL